MHIDEATRQFLALSRIAVVGVSRTGDSPANAIADRFREAGHEVFSVNPSGEDIDGHPTFASLEAIDGDVQGVVVVTPAAAAAEVAKAAGRIGAEWIWFHQGFGPVSYDHAALEAARAAGLKTIAVGCPMMYLQPDVAHRCFRAIFRWVGRIPTEIDVPTT